MGPFCMDDLRTLRDVENLIDLFDERYTVSLVTGLMILIPSGS